MDDTLDLGSLSLRDDNLLNESDPFSPPLTSASAQLGEEDHTLRLKSTSAVPLPVPQPSEADRLRDDQPGDDVETSLRQERDALRTVNASLETTFANLSTAKEKIERFGTTVATTHDLMDLYTRLLSQATHTQQLLLDGEWELAADAARLREEQEAERARVQEAERAEQEERDRLEREERQRDEAHRRSENSATAARRARGAPRGRGAIVSNRGSRPPNAAAVASSAPGVETASDRALRGSASVSGVRGVRGLRSRVVTRGRGVNPPE